MPENVRRLGALVLAALLVVAALLWRARRDDGGTTSSPTTAPATPEIVCATEVAEVCGAVFGNVAKIEPAGATADRLVKADRSPDVWVTLDPWPTIVADRRQRANQSAFDVTPHTVASTKVGLVAPQDRLTVLQQYCAAKPLWVCLGEVSGQKWEALKGNTTWQTIKPGYVRPDASAGGYAVFANAVVAEIGKTSFSNAELDKINSWGRRLEAGVPTIEPDKDPLDQLQLGVPTRDIVGVLEANVPSPLRTGLTVLYPEPVANVQVIAVTGPSYSLPANLDSVLRAHHWSVPAIPTSGLPESGLADAVIEFWKGVKGP